MRHTRRRTLSLVSASCAVLAGTALPTLVAAPAEAAAPRAIVGNTHPSWATESTEVGQAPSAKQISARVYLASRDQAGLDQAFTAVTTPGSASYGKYVTPAQYRARFGPAADAATKVASWLRGSGLTVSGPQQNGRYVQVSGPVAAAERAFGTDLALFRHDGGTYQAPAESVTVPAAVSGLVLSITGLSEAPAFISPKTDNGATPRASASPAAAASGPKSPAGVPAGYRSATPCSTYYGQLKARYKADGKTPLPSFAGAVRPYTVCGYRPNQLRSAYGAPAALTGKGVTVAIIDAYMSSTLLADANKYSKKSGIAPFAPGQYSTLVPKGKYRDQNVCGADDWSTEQALDVEAFHGFAPDAKLIYVAGRSCSASDLFDAQAAVVDDNRASIVSLSYGGIESSESPIDARLDTQLFKQAALQGIGFYIASGDNGDELIATGEKQVDSSGSNPYATAVGGTSLAIGAQGQYLFEAGWGTHRYSLSSTGKKWVEPSFYGGAGGGQSRIFARPFYQNGVLWRGIPPGRAVPDVAMDADPNTGMIIGLTQDFPPGVRYDEYRIGGTSLASPLFAAVQALASQAQGKRLGFANPRIYRLYKSALGYGVKAFRDVTPAHDAEANARADYLNGFNTRHGLIYSVRTFDDDTSLATRKGWDHVTGVGSPSPAYYTAR